MTAYPVRLFVPKNNQFRFSMNVVILLLVALVGWVQYTDSSLLPAETTSLCYLQYNFTELAGVGWDCTNQALCDDPPPGLRCSDGHVTEIYLRDLSGDIFPSDLDFPYLSILNIDSRFSSPYPNFWYNSPNITQVRTYGFTGAIPDFIIPLNQLVYFETYELEGVGRFPSNMVTHTPNLREWHIEGAGFTGTFPDLPQSFTHVHFSDNAVTTWPTTFDMIKNTKEFHLRGAQINGSAPFPNDFLVMRDVRSMELPYVPATLPTMDFPDLYNLVLQNIEGTDIPDLSQLPSLEKLSINTKQDLNLPQYFPPQITEIYLESFNMNGGPCPKFENMTQIRIIYMSWINCAAPVGYLDHLFTKIPTLNELFMFGINISSTIPPSLASTTLKKLFIHSASLSGTITDSLFPPTLEYLELVDNGLTGSIPRLLHLGPTLYQLDLSSNQFSGTLPSFNLPEIVNLAMSNNQLVGTLPVSLRESTKLAGLYLDENRGLVKCLTPFPVSDTCQINRRAFECRTCKNYTIILYKNGTFWNSSTTPIPTPSPTDYITLEYTCPCNVSFACGASCVLKGMCVDGSRQGNLTCISGRWIADFNITESVLLHNGEYLFPKSLNVSNNSTLDINSNSIVNVNGDIYVTAGSVVSIADESKIYIKGEGVFDSAMSVEVTGNSTEDSIISVGGCAKVSGTLNVKAYNNGSNGVDRDVPLLHASCITGNFSAIQADIPCTSTSLKQTATQLTIAFRPVSNCSPASNLFFDYLYYFVGGAVLVIGIIVGIIVAVCVCKKQHSMASRLRTTMAKQ